MNACKRTTGRTLAIFAATLAGLMFSATPASAVNNCVAEASGFKANQTGCTAEDVTIAAVNNICVIDPNNPNVCSPTQSCKEGTDANGNPLTVTFKADYTVQLQTKSGGGQQQRY